jgi:diphosphomevalonate decarboxylase
MNGGLHQKYLDGAVGYVPGGMPKLRSAWRSPSNIALVKYWGKKPGQLPASPSLSFTLSKSFTEMELAVGQETGGDMEIGYYFEEKENKAFESRIRAYMQAVNPYFPFLSGRSITIRSRNTFPHSSGIASSASSMSALALCLCSLEKQILGGSKDEDFFRKASYMARLGSGSAARSVFGGFVTWGRHSGIEKTSDEHATPLGGSAGAAFASLHDAVLIVSPGTKSVSSRKGHALMDEHPFASARYQQAGENFLEMRRAIYGNEVDAFIHITENEAFTLHGLMMSSDPPILLLKPGTLRIISLIRQFRQDTGSFVAFTLDAGPNIHLVYPETEREKVLAFIRDELLGYCCQEQWIDDRMGTGPAESPG